MYRRTLSFSLHRSARWALAIGLLVSFALFASIYELEQRNDEIRFERRAHSRATSIEQGMINATEALASVNHLFSITAGDADREQFRSVSHSILARNPYIDTFAFQRVLTSQEKPGFEARMSAEFPGFQVFELIDGQRVPARARPRYRVVDYIEPSSRQADVLGLDTTSLDFMDDAMQLAEDTGRPAATGLFRLFRSGGEKGIRIFMPVYRGGALPGTIPERRQAVTGYTVAVLRANDLFEKILRSAAGALGNDDLDIRIYAAGEPDESQLAYSSAGQSPEAWQSPELFNDGLEPYFYHFIAGGRPWYVVIDALPTPFFPRHTVALLSFMVVLLITLGATTYLHSVGRRGRYIEELVTQRTEEISQLNRRLSDDIRAREQAEKALALNQERVRDMADISSDWYWEQDEHFRFVNLSTDALGRGGVSPGIPLPPGVLGVTRWELPVDLEASDWAAHRAVLEAHLPFKDFEYKTSLPGVPIEWISASGKPIFDADGRFKGYRGTAKNITDRKRAEEALSRSRTALRKLANHMNQVKEDERKRIARDIHDDLGQSLMALRIDVSLTQKHQNLPLAVKEGIAGILGQIDTIIKAVRSIINDLRPAVLDLGLHAAVEWQAKEFERRTGISCRVHFDHDEFVLDDLRATALFRIVQEALNNIKRHAQASAATIELVRRDSTLEMRISDNGIGLPPDSRRKAGSFGLAGVEERVYMLGGSFSITGSAGQGTTILLSVPVQAPGLALEHSGVLSPA